MTSNLRFSLLLVATSLVFACTSSTDESYTKEEARSLAGLTADGDDICALEGWYEDGVCDDFCTELDPPCATCAAVPTCDVGEVEHSDASECPADASCREVAECGATIWCSDTTTCAAVPTCDEGESEHSDSSGCPADGSCREVTECGATIWCGSGPVITCFGDNPEGCVSAGCDLGMHCDTTMGEAPSGCDCDPSSGNWTCTPDLSGGVCVAD